MIKLEEPAQLDPARAGILEQRNSPLMEHDTTRSQSGTVDLPTTKTETNYARIPFSAESTSLKPCIFKTFAAICGLTVPDKITRIRSTRATNIELGRQAHCHPKRIGVGLVKLEQAGLVVSAPVDIMGKAAYAQAAKAAIITVFLTNMFCGCDG